MKKKKGPRVDNKTIPVDFRTAKPPAGSEFKGPRDSKVTEIDFSIPGVSDEELRAHPRNFTSSEPDKREPMIFPRKLVRAPDGRILVDVEATIRRAEEAATEAASRWDKAPRSAS